jgi:CBS domain-containing protein
MQLKDVMTRDVEIVEFDTSLQDAANKMGTLDVGVLPVREGNQLVGMLTDRDITIRAVAAGRDPKQTTVGEVMSPDLVYCYEDQDVKVAAQMMADHQIRRLPVLNRDQQLVGIVSLGDLAVDLADDKLTGEALEEISEPARPSR